MATYITEGRFLRWRACALDSWTNELLEPSIGELRWIARLDPDLLPNEEPFGDVSTTGGGEAIEGSDVVSITVRDLET